MKARIDSLIGRAGKAKASLTRLAVEVRGPEIELEFNLAAEAVARAIKKLQQCQTAQEQNQTQLFS